VDKKGDDDDDSVSEDGQDRRKWSVRKKRQKAKRAAYRKAERRKAKGGAPPVSPWKGVTETNLKVIVQSPLKLALSRLTRYSHVCAVLLMDAGATFREEEWSLRELERAMSLRDKWFAKWDESNDITHVYHDDRRDDDEFADDSSDESDSSSDSSSDSDGDGEGDDGGEKKEEKKKKAKKKNPVAESRARIRRALEAVYAGKLPEEKKKEKKKTAEEEEDEEKASKKKTTKGGRKKPAAVRRVEERRERREAEAKLRAERAKATSNIRGHPADTSLRLAYGRILCDLVRKQAKWVKKPEPDEIAAATAATASATPSSPTRKA